jgi:hypothetical protein
MTNLLCLTEINLKLIIFERQKKNFWRSFILINLRINPAIRYKFF